MDERKIIVDSITKDSSFAEDELLAVLGLLRLNPDIFNEGCTAPSFNTLLSDICKPNPQLRQAILTSVCKSSATSLPGGKISLKSDALMRRFWDHVLTHDFPSEEVKSIVDSTINNISAKENGLRRQTSSVLVSGVIDIASSKVLNSDLERSQSTVVDAPESVISPSDANASYLDDGFEEASSSVVLNSPTAKKAPASSLGGLESDSAISAGENVDAYLDYDFDEASTYSEASPKSRAKGLSVPSITEEASEVDITADVGEKPLSQGKKDVDEDTEAKVSQLLLRHSDSNLGKSAGNTPHAFKPASPRSPPPLAKVATEGKGYGGVSKLVSGGEAGNEGSGEIEDDHTDAMLGALLRDHSTRVSAAPSKAATVAAPTPSGASTGVEQPTVETAASATTHPEEGADEYGADEYEAEDSYEDEFDTDVPTNKPESNTNSRTNSSLNLNSCRSPESASPKLGQAARPGSFRAPLGKSASAKLKQYESHLGHGSSYRHPALADSPDASGLTGRESPLGRDERSQEGPKQRTPLISRSTSSRSSAQILGKKYQPPPEPLPMKSEAEVADIRANIMAPTKSFIMRVKSFKEEKRPVTAGALPPNKKTHFKVTDRKPASASLLRQMSKAKIEFDRPPPSPEGEKKEKPQSAPLLARDIVRPSSRNLYTQQMPSPTAAPANPSVKPASAEAWAALQACAMDVHCSEVNYKTARKNPRAAYIRHDQLNQMMWLHLRTYLKRAIRKLRLVYRSWQNRIQESLRMSIDCLNRSYLEQVDQIQQYKDEFINTKNNPLLAAFTSSGTTHNKQFTSSSSRLHKTVILVRTEGFHMNAIASMTNAVEVPLQRLSEAFRVQYSQFRNTMENCKMLVKNSANLVSAFNGQMARNFAFSDKVRISVMQTESVIRNNIQRTAFLCDDLRSLFSLSGFEGDSLYFTELRDMLASALLQVTVDNAESYPHPNAVVWLHSDETGKLRGVGASPSASRAPASTVNKRPTSAPLANQQGSSSGPNYHPHSAVSHDRPHTHTAASMHGISDNAALEDVLTASEALSSGLAGKEGTTAVANGGMEKAWHEEDISTDDDRPAPRAVRRPEEDMYADDDQFIQEDSCEDDAGPDESSRWSPPNTKTRKQIVPVNTRFRDKNMAAPVNNDYVDVRAQTMVEASTSTVKPKVTGSARSKPFSRMRPLSSKTKQELKLQALPTFMYEAECSSGLETQWHELPCPGCQKLFKGRGYIIPTLFSVDKDVVQFLRGGTSPLKKKINLTWSEEGEVAGATDKPSSSYRRLNSALTSSKRIERNSNLFNKYRGRTSSATMKTANQMQQGGKHKEYCSWKCMKIWLRKNFNVQKRYETELLIDLSAGYLVEVD